MAQQVWTFLDPFGVQHHVGLYHGEDSGNVLVYCDHSILIIDFKILENKEYSFFFGEELLKLIITKQTAGEFLYDLKVDKAAQTPLNRRIAETEKREKDYILIALLALMIIILVVVFINRMH